MIVTQSSLTDRVRSFGRLYAAGILVAWTLVLVNCDVVPRQGWNEEWGPMVPHETFPGDCGTCHVTEGWEVLREDFSFDHEKETGHALEGAHARAACLRCHNDRGPAEFYFARGCGGCHADPHESTLGLDCSRCHQQENWRPDGYVNEHARTTFPLLGMHSVVACENCHQQAPVGEFRGAPVLCELCHQDDLNRATSPDHVANGLVTGCEGCHTPLGWGENNFNHGFFPLLGGHSGVQCTQCHRGGSLRSISPDCVSCHESDYQQAPNHVALNFNRDCTRCHSIVSWRP